ncbi:MAG: tetratricopeptide repeat protein [Chlorobiaceae bacterium]|nr:tetratricopeptide repeat protein [Chlorobiaceae bacterium]
MTQSIGSKSNEQRTYAENIVSIARYFTDTEGGAFRFAVTDDDLVQRRFNTELRQVLRGKGVPVEIHDWSKASPPDMYPAEQLRRLKAAHPETKGIICIGLERAMWENPEMLTMLNFAREALAEVGVPLFFWISFKTLPLMSRYAIDLYNQRIGANLYFEHDAETTDTDGSAMRFIAHETVQANRDLRPLEARLKLLEKQFDELKKIESPEKLANDIVLELLRVYIQIPGMVPMVQSLIDEYGGFVDTEKPENCFALAEVNRYLGEVQHAEHYYHQALQQYRILAAQNPEAWLSDVAGTLNNLAVLQQNQKKYDEAEQKYSDALNIYKTLVINKSTIFLFDVAHTLNNLASLRSDRHQYAESVKDFTNALDVYRELAKSNSEKYLPYVAGVLNNIAITQYYLHQYSEAEKSYQEGLSVYRELVKNNPHMYQYNIGLILNNLAMLQVELNQFEEAKQNIENALVIRRELASIDPKLYLSDVAVTLINMAMLYMANMPNGEKPLSCIAEALPILLPLSETQSKARQAVVTAFKIIKDLCLDPDEFIANLNDPANSASSPES